MPNKKEPTLKFAKWVSVAWKNIAQGTFKKCCLHSFLKKQDLK